MINEITKANKPRWAAVIWLYLQQTCDNNLNLVMYTLLDDRLKSSHYPYIYEIILTKCVYFSNKWLSECLHMNIKSYMLSKYVQVISINNDNTHQV